MDNSVLIPETYFNSQREARNEAARIRKMAVRDELLVKVEESPYGGYCLKIVPIDLAFDMPAFLAKESSIG
jgi:hypothetical protein